MNLKDMKVGDIIVADVEVLESVDIEEVNACDEGFKGRGPSLGK